MKETTLITITLIGIVATISYIGFGLITGSESIESESLKPQSIILLEISTIIILCVTFFVVILSTRYAPYEDITKPVTK